MENIINEMPVKRNAHISTDLHQSTVTKFIEVNETMYAYRELGKTGRTIYYY